MHRIYIVILIALLWSQSAFAVTPIFGPLASDSLASPDSMAMGDFNSDGKLDLVIADSTNGIVAIQYGNGDGTFGAPVVLSEGGMPNDVVTADLGHNGRLYLLVSDLAANTVTVFKSEGNGNFAKAYVVTGVSVWRIRMVDFNGDGIPDLALIPYGGTDAKVSLFPGLGNGTFGEAYEVDVGAQISDVNAGDLNGDGIPDLVVSDFDDQRLLVYKATSPGSYSSPTIIQLDRPPECTRLVKDPASGFLDIISEDIEVTDTLGTPDGQVDVFLGMGNGTFQAPVSYASTDGSAALEVADLNGDNIPDLILVHPDIAAVSILLGTGDGHYVDHGLHRMGYGSWNVVVGDFNGDHRLDIVTANELAGSVMTLLNEGAGVFAAQREYAGLEGVFPVGQLLGPYDFDRDGNPDFINNFSVLINGSLCRSVDVLSAKHGLLVPSAQPVFDCASLQVVAVHDMNGDGNLDLIITGSAGLGIAYGNGDGTFSAPVNLNITDTGSTTVVDFDGDGRPDIVQHGLAPSEGQVSIVVYKQQPDGTFVAGTPIQFAQPPAFSDFNGVVAYGDFNHDGLMDTVTSVYIQDPSNHLELLPQISLYLNQGSGVFTLQSQYTFGIDEVNPGVNIVDDLNGDGWMDLVVASKDGFKVLLNDGHGGLLPAVDYSMGSECEVFAYGDVDGDDIPDILCANWGAGTFAIAHGHGDGTFDPGVIYGGVSNPTQVFIADMNGDGKTDLLFQAGPMRAPLPFTSEGPYMGGATIVLQRPLGQPVPPIASYQRYVVPMDHSLSIPLQFTDESGQPVQIDMLSSPPNGTWSVGGVNEGTLFYTPDFHTQSSFVVTYQVTTATGTSNVGYIDVGFYDSDSPPQAGTAAYGIAEGASFEGSFPGSDLNGDALTYSITEAPAHGVAQLLDPSTGAYSYQPDAGFTGLDHVPYRVCDWEHCSSAWIYFAVGSAPPTAFNASLGVDRNTPATGAVQGVDSKGHPPKAGSVDFKLIDGPSHGTLTFNPQGTFTYQPRLDYSGPDRFTFVAYSSILIKNQFLALNSNTATVSINVVEHAPVAFASKRVVFVRGPYASRASAHDVDVGDTLVFRVTSEPRHGTLIMDRSGNYTYTPGPGFRGLDKFQFNVTDGTRSSNSATISLRVL